MELVSVCGVHVGLCNVDMRCEQRCALNRGTKWRTASFAFWSADNGQGNLVPSVCWKWWAPGLDGGSKNPSATEEQTPEGQPAVSLQSEVFWSIPHKMQE